MAEEAPPDAPMYARVLVDIDAPHLDELFDYLVPDSLRELVEVGSVVQVRFGPRRVNGYVAALSQDTEFSGKVSAVLKVVSPLPVASESLLRTVSYLAVRYGASRSQLLSFVMPPRRARVEKSMGAQLHEARKRRLGDSEPGPSTVMPPPTRRVQTVLPGTRFEVIAEIVRREMDADRGVLLIAPAAPLAARVADQLASVKGAPRVGLIDADQSLDRRYRTYLQAMLGQFDVLVGTRSAVWTDMPRLGAIIIWDDGDDRHRERRAPHLDSLDIAVARSHVEGLSLFSLAYARSLKSQALVETRWASDSTPSRLDALGTVPRVSVFDAFAADREGATGRARLPQAAFRLVRESLDRGPVLIQVPAAGGVTQTEEGFVRIGSDRIGEELQRAFPAVPITVSSSTAGVTASLDSSARVVVATAGAEPSVDEGYAAAIITDASSLAYASQLDGTLQVLRRWMNALSLVRPRGPALLVGEVPTEVLDALVYWDPAIFVKKEWRTNQELGFPPARWVVLLEGERRSVEAMLDAAQARLGDAEVHFPGTPFAPLTLVASQSFPSPQPEGGDKARVIVSVAPRNIQVLMGEFARVRRELSRTRGPLPRTVINPNSLVGP